MAKLVDGLEPQESCLSGADYTMIAAWNFSAFLEQASLKCTHLHRIIAIIFPIIQYPALIVLVMFVAGPVY